LTPFYLKESTFIRNSGTIYRSFDIFGTPPLELPKKLRTPIIAYFSMLNAKIDSAL